MDALASTPLGWLYVGVTALFGVTVLFVAKRSPMEKRTVLVWSLLPAALALLCAAALGAAGGLGALCAVSVASAVYLGGRTMLPVGDKAVLITGELLHVGSGDQKLGWFSFFVCLLSHKRAGKLCVFGLAIYEMHACKVSFIYLFLFHFICFAGDIYSR